MNNPKIQKSPSFSATVHSFLFPGKLFYKSAEIFSILCCPLAAEHKTKHYSCRKRRVAPVFSKVVGRNVVAVCFIRFKMSFKPKKSLSLSSSQRSTTQTSLKNFLIQEPQQSSGSIGQPPSIPSSSNKQPSSWRPKPVAAV